MNRKELKKKYIDTIQPMGIYQVRNLINGKIFIQSAVDLNGKINSCKFQLSMGSHMNKILQADYDNMGAENFVFEILDSLKPKENIKMDYTKELKLLEHMWIEKLQPYGEQGYHKRLISK